MSTVFDLEVPQFSLWLSSPCDPFRSFEETPMVGVHYKSTTGTFAYRRTKIATSPFIYRGERVFMPEKMGNLQRRFEK